MKIITAPDELQHICMKWRVQGQKTALVPTMGYYHEGHISLMQYARKVGQKVVVSLFVNPTQFGQGEDLAAYPRNPERDAAIAESNGVDILYMPQSEDMYSPGHATWVEVPKLAQTMCGISRPTHFRGVCTVVLKLLMLALPEIAVFGQKDWQQAAILKRMVADLNIPVTLHTCPIIREEDGLAMSSRNVYLTPEERSKAPHLYKSLCLAADLAASGETDVPRIMTAMRGYWKQNLPEAQEDYLTIVDPDTLTPIEYLSGAALCALAVRLGKARLIDNMLLQTKVS